MSKHTLPATVDRLAVADTWKRGAGTRMGPHYKGNEQEAIGLALADRYNEHAALTTLESLITHTGPHTFNGITKCRVQSQMMDSAACPVCALATLRGGAK